MAALSVSPNLPKAGLVNHTVQDGPISPGDCFTGYVGSGPDWQSTSDGAEVTSVNWRPCPISTATRLAELLTTSSLSRSVGASDEQVSARRAV
jgi:hypothetical protein